MELLQALYTAPSGESFTFLYRDVEKETDLKTAVFTFPERDGALVQSLGRGGRRFPMECVFSGESCIEDADAFESGLEQKGYGELQHPVYGTRKVVPTGTIKRSDPVVSGVSTSVVSVTFSETIVDDVTSSTVVQTDAIDSDFDAVADGLCSDFAKNIAYTNASEQVRLTVTLKDNAALSYQNMLSLAKLAGSKSQKLYTDFQALQSESYSYINALSTLADAPLEFARTIFNIYSLPSHIAVAVALMKEGYKSAYKSLATEFFFDPAGSVNVSNQFNSTKISLGACVASLAFSMKTAAADGGFKSRADALSAVDDLNNLTDTYTKFLDKYDGKNVFVDDSESFYTFKRFIGEVEHFLIDTAFALPSVRSVVLGRDRQVIELVAELYGNLDRLDEFISENNLNADEIEVIPMGREVSYYVG